MGLPIIVLPPPEGPVFLLPLRGGGGSCNRQYSKTITCFFWRLEFNHLLGVESQFITHAQSGKTLTVRVVANVSHELMSDIRNRSAVGSYNRLFMCVYILLYFFILPVSAHTWRIASSRGQVVHMPFLVLPYASLLAKVVPVQ